MYIINAVEYFANSIFCLYIFHESALDSSNFSLNSHEREYDSLFQNDTLFVLSFVNEEFVLSCGVGIWK